MRTPPARTRGLAALAALAAAHLLAGCGVVHLPFADHTDAPSTDTTSSAPLTLLPEGTTEVRIAAGETVQVSLGIGSPGVGDDWGVVSGSGTGVADATVVLGAEVAGARRDPETAQPGASLPYAVSITGTGTGTTTLRVLYCTRSAIAEGCDQSQGTREAPVAPVEITVVVP